MKTFKGSKNLYHLNRYIGTALFLSRFLKTQLRQLSENEDPAKHMSLSWDWVFKSTGIKPPGGNLLNMPGKSSKHFHLADAYTLVDYITFEKDQSHSLLNCVQSAKEAAVLSRKHMNENMWKELTRLHSCVKNAQMNQIWPGKTLDFYSTIIKSIHDFYKVTGQMPKDPTWEVLNLSRFLNQLQFASSVISTHINFVIGEQEEAQSGLICLLLYLGAYDLYRQCHSSFSLSEVMHLLIKDLNNPHSLHFALIQTESHLQSLGFSVSSADSPSLSSLKESINHFELSMLSELVLRIHTFAVQTGKHVKTHLQ